MGKKKELRKLQKENHRATVKLLEDTIVKLLEVGVREFNLDTENRELRDELDHIREYVAKIVDSVIADTTPTSRIRIHVLNVYKEMGQKSFITVPKGTGMQGMGIVGDPE